MQWSRTLAAATVAITLAGCGRGDPQPKATGAVLDPSAIAVRYGDAVWRIETEGCGWRGTGSAFAIDRRHLVTNRHVVLHDSSPTVRSRRGRVLDGRVIGASETPDLAVIEVSSDLTPTLGWTSSDALSEGDPLAVMGYPAPSHAFRAERGDILSFRGGDKRRDALLSNARIDRGNSGGPALRADGTVAGVVTEMAVEGRAGQRVAIVFTADSVEAAVAGFLDRPASPRSSCGLGPDYVPPVPSRFEIPARLPPPPSVPQAPPTSRATQAPTTVTRPAAVPIVPRQTTTSSAPCPAGRAEARVRYVDATPVQGQDGWWEVRVRGTVHNETSEAVLIEEIAVTIPGDPPRVGRGFADQGTLQPGGGTNWEANDFVHSSAQPTIATAALSWSWIDSGRAACPSP